MIQREERGERESEGGEERECTRSTGRLRGEGGGGEREGKGRQGGSGEWGERWGVERGGLERCGGGKGGYSGERGRECMRSL